MTNKTIIDALKGLEVGESITIKKANDSMSLLRATCKLPFDVVSTTSTWIRHCVDLKRIN